MWQIRGLQALFLHLSMQGWLVERSPFPGHNQEPESMHWLSLCGHHCPAPDSWQRLKALHCIIWPYGSSKTHCLRAITMIDCLKLPTVASFHGASSNSVGDQLSLWAFLKSYPLENLSSLELAFRSNCQMYLFKATHPIHSESQYSSTGLSGFRAQTFSYNVVLTLGIHAFICSEHVN